MAEHSPLPWSVGSRNAIDPEAECGVTAFDGMTVCDLWNSVNIGTECDGEMARANAEFIVRCVNSHDALLAALKHLVECLNDDLDPEQCAAWDAALAAIAKAEGR